MSVLSTAAGSDRSLAYICCRSAANDLQIPGQTKSFTNARNIKYNIFCSVVCGLSTSTALLFDDVNGIRAYAAEDELGLSCTLRCMFYCLLLSQFLLLRQRQHPSTTLSVTSF